MLASGWASKSVNRPPFIVFIAKSAARPSGNDTSTLPFTVLNDEGCFGFAVKRDGDRTVHRVRAAGSGDLVHLDQAVDVVDVEVAARAVDDHVAAVDGAEPQRHVARHADREVEAHVVVHAAPTARSRSFHGSPHTWPLPVGDRRSDPRRAVARNRDARRAAPRPGRRAFRRGSPCECSSAPRRHWSPSTWMKPLIFRTSSVRPPPAAKTACGSRRIHPRRRTGTERCACADPISANPMATVARLRFDMPGMKGPGWLEAVAGERRVNG